MKNTEEKLLDKEWEFDSTYQGFCMKVVSIKQNDEEKFIYEIYMREYVSGRYRGEKLIESCKEGEYYNSKDECQEATFKFMDSDEFVSKWRSNLMTKVRIPRKLKKSIKKSCLDCDGYLLKKFYKQLRIETFEYEDKSDGVSYLHKIDESNLQFRDNKRVQ